MGPRPVGWAPHCYARSVDDELHDYVRSRQDLIETHITDSDIVDIITALKEKAKLGSYEHAKAVVELKYGKNPEPPKNDRTLEDLLWESPLGPTPGPGAI